MASHDGRHSKWRSWAHRKALLLHDALRRRVHVCARCRAYPYFRGGFAFQRSRCTAGIPAAARTPAVRSGRADMRCPKPITCLNLIAVSLFAAAMAMNMTDPIAVEAAAGPEASNSSPPPQAAAPQKGYVGTETCATCHTGFDASINATKHGQARNPRTPAAAQGCETCHGPGEAHANDPEKVKPRMFDKLAAQEVSATCTTCHNRGVHAMWQGSQHEQRNVSCVSCHSIHKPRSKIGRAHV